MYAAGQIPGSFFRREGRPSTDAILTCRLIDRPLRPSFVNGLRNEVQVVITVLSLNPHDPYDVVAINAASLSTQLVRPALLRPDRRRPGRAHRRPVGRLPDVRPARATPSSTWSSPAASSTPSDVAIMMVEAEATDGAWNLIQGGAHGAHRGGRRPGARGRQAVPQPALRRGPAAGRRRRRQADRGLPALPGLPAGRVRRRQGAAEGDLVRRMHDRRQAGARVPPRRDQGPPSRPPWPASSRAARRRSPPRSARSPSASSASASCATRSGSTAAAWPTSASSPPRSRCCPASTARRCSSAARPRSWASPR